MVCGLKHHTKLHQDVSPSQTGLSDSSQDSAIVNVATSYHNVVNINRRAILSTAIVTLRSPKGESITARALLDSGAEESFISERLASLLNLRQHEVQIAVVGVGAGTSAIAKR